jgi:hypothetical protein
VSLHWQARVKFIIAATVVATKPALSPAITLKEGICLDDILKYLILMRVVKK